MRWLARQRVRRGRVFDADDVVQTAALKALRQDCYDPARYELRRWADIIVRSAAADLFRGRWCPRPDEDAVQAAPDRRPEVPQQAGAREEAAAVRAAVGELPEHQRAAVAWRFHLDGGLGRDARVAKVTKFRYAREALDALRARFGLPPAPPRPRPEPRPRRQLRPPAEDPTVERLRSPVTLTERVLSLFLQAPPGKALTTVRISDHLGVSHQQVAGVVSRMLTRGLLRVAPGEGCLRGPLFPD
jgi:RNA polymerase sigma factor (sigma-70 family)